MRSRLNMADLPSLKMLQQVTIHGSVAPKLMMCTTEQNNYQRELGKVNLVHKGKLRYIKNIKNLPLGAMYSSACCPDLSRGENMPGQIEKT